MEYIVTLKKVFIFELKSLFGRTFLNNKPNLHNVENYLNLGCGTNIIRGYVNADFFRFKFWEKDYPPYEWQLDLRYPLKCKNDTFDGIYTEHTIEHLYPEQVKLLVSELYRILKPGAYIRISTPDIEKYVNFYIRNYSGIDKIEFSKKYNTGCAAIRNITQNYFHVSVWDFEEIKIYLENAGFKNIKKMSFGKSSDKKLEIDLKNREWETVYVEAQKK